MECQNKEKSTIMSIMSDMVGVILKTLQSGIIDRVEQAIGRAVRDAIGAVMFAFLILVGFIFFLVGTAIWLGSFFGLGVGLMIVGGLVFILTLFMSLIQKNR